MAVTTENYEEAIIPKAFKKCPKCKGERKLSGMKTGYRTIYIFILCKACNETFEVSFQVEWIGEVC